MDTTKELLKKSAAEAVDILSKLYAEKQAQMTKSAENEALRQAILGGAIGGGAAGLGSLGYNYLRGKKMSLKDTLYAALAGAVPGAALGGMLPENTIGKLPFDVTFGIDPFSKDPSAGADSAGAGDVTPVGAGGQINSPPIPRGIQEIPKEWSELVPNAVGIGIGGVGGNVGGSFITRDYKDLPRYSPLPDDAKALKDVREAIKANKLPGQPGHDKKLAKTHAAQEAAIQKNIARSLEGTNKGRASASGPMNRVTRGGVKGTATLLGALLGNHVIPRMSESAGALASSITDFNKWLAPPKP